MGLRKKHNESHLTLDFIEPGLQTEIVHIYIE
jgi:hypothetical protein